MRLHARTSHLRLTLTLAAAATGALLLASCRQETVMRDSAQTPPKHTATGAEVPPAHAATPPVAPASGQPAAPSGPTPSGSPGAPRKGPAIATVPLMTSPYKQPTPEPTLKPRPAPPPKIVDGKIVQEWLAPPEAAKLVSPVKDQPDAAKIGRSYYLQRCDGCHGKEGLGNGWMSQNISKPPTNLASDMVQANSDGELFWKITHGRSPMPANRVRFSDEERWYIVSFLRTLKKKK
jgi:mono/diheme cytochrome c family protein